MYSLYVFHFGYRVHFSDKLVSNGNTFLIRILIPISRQSRSLITSVELFLNQAISIRSTIFDTLSSHGTEIFSLEHILMFTCSRVILASLL